ncbi:ComF family protein [Vibrio sp. TRT 29B02]|uniref:ComF family protein n=1 Tax=Vibrio sp. TRT 29B02 TaxID=3418508 RepID=UPI003CEEB877
MLAQRVGKYIADLLPVYCGICSLEVDSTTEIQGVCRHCSQYFEPLPRCLRCGLPMVTEAFACGECLKRPPIWQRVYCVGDYQFPLSNYVYRYKYRGQFWLSGQLSSMLAARIEQPAQLVTSVPMHWRRYWVRGYNQSDLLAQAIARKLNVSYQPLFRRLRATPPQAGLSRVERKENLLNAFALQGQQALTQHVAIVDDVLTTGSTVYHLCKLLLEAGVKTVDIYCICRTPEPAS